MDLYNELLREGIAKECARFVLPLATPTRIYMSGRLLLGAILISFWTWNTKRAHGYCKCLQGYI